LTPNQIRRAFESLEIASIARISLAESFQITSCIPVVKPQSNSPVRCGPRQLTQSDGMRRPVSGRDAMYAPKLSTCSKHKR